MLQYTSRRILSPGLLDFSLNPDLFGFTNTRFAQPFSWDIYSASRQHQVGERHIMQKLHELVMQR